MGQRHQLFVIARINGKYRCLAAVHHQWLYGQTALFTCLTTIGHFRDAKNKVPLQAELNMAGKHDEDFWERSRSYDDIEVHFPFIMTCLVLGASFDTRDGYHHSVNVEPFCMKYNEGDNNNGITIFDITDPARTRYCFVDYYGMESERPVQLMAPLNARVYLEAYYEIDDRHLSDLIDRFGALPVVTTAALDNTWPDQSWQEPTDIDIIQEEPSLDISKLQVSNLEASNVVSLRARTMGQLAEAFAANEEVDSEALSEVEFLQDFWPTMRQKLYDNTPNLGNSTSKLDLLSRSIKEDVFVDLTPFTTLSTSAILRLVRNLSDERNMKHLNLPEMPGSCKDDLESALQGADLQKLYLMANESNVSTQLEGLRLSCDIYEHNLLKRSLVFSEEGGCIQPLPLLTFPSKHSITHVAWIGIAHMFLAGKNSTREDGSMSWDRLQVDKSTHDRYGIVTENRELGCKKIPLTDVPMPMTRILAGLRTFTLWSCAGQLRDRRSLFQSIASSFAIGMYISPSSYKTTIAEMNWVADLRMRKGHDIGGGIGPLSAELYLQNDYHRIHHDELKPGEWAIVIFHPYYDAYSSIEEQMAEWEKMGTKAPFPSRKCSYAMVGPPEGPESDLYRVVDMPTFLRSLGIGEEVERLTAWWENQVEGGHFLEYYAKDDIQDVLGKIYGPLKDVKDKI